MATVDEPNNPGLKTPSPLDHVARQSRRVSHMCDLLEALADDLPRRPAPVWRETRHQCNRVIPVHYRTVLDVFVPILLRKTHGELDCKEVLFRVRADFEDEAFRLAELNDLLVDAISNDTSTIGPEALGYALRGFFGAIRRNTFWETDVLLPLARRRLEAKDLTELARNLSTTH